MQVSAVIFDLFETLITEFADGSRISKRSYNYAELLGISNEDYKAEWKKRQQQRMDGKFVSYEAVLLDIAASWGLETKQEAIDYLVEARLQEKTIPFARISDGIIALLEELKRRNIKIGLISNCSEEEVRGWRGSRLAGYFDDWLFSYEVGCSKPNTEIYKLACERLNVRADSSVFVGDGGSDELAGAQRAGFRTVLQAIWYNSYLPSNYKRLKAPAALMDELDAIV